MAFEVNLPAFKDTVNPPFADVFKCQYRYIVLWGGRGSGKTHAAVMKIIYMLLCLPYFKGILIRKVYETIKESQYESIKQTIEDLGLASLFEFKTSPLSIVCVNGNRLIARGLDKADKIKGVKDPSFAWYEEGNEMDETDFITVTSTIRSSKAPYLQEIFSFNPESSEPDFHDFWIHKRFFSDTNEKTFDTTVEVDVDDETVEYMVKVIHSTYKDNKHLPSSIRAIYEDYKRTNPHYYEVYTKGLWGNKEIGNRFYKTFSLSNVKAVEYNPNLPLHISLDENVTPYLTLTVHQLEGLQVRQINEICLKSPRNTLRITCEEFSRIYENHTSGLYIYGDRTSKKQDTKLEKGENFFTLARNYLLKYRPIERLPSQNPAVKSRGEFINQIFAGNIPDVSITIGENCVNSTADYLYLKEAADGTKFKEKTVDKVSKVRFEKYGHCFVAGTMIRTEKGLKPIEKIKIGDKVWTRKGLKPVLRSGLTRENATVKTYLIDGKQITCTKDHKIYTENKGFKEVDILTGTNTFCIFTEWEKKVLDITGIHLTGIPTQKGCPTKNTLRDGLKKVKNNICTGMFTKKKSEEYQKDFTYTTKTAMLITTTLKTLIVYITKSITDIIGLRKQTNKNKEQKIFYKTKLDQKPQNGTEAKKAENGIKNKLKIFTKKIKELLNVMSVAKKRKAEAQLLNFALVRAKIDTTQEYTADVYDLNVKDCHEFFANDILVHNCSDANDYLYCEIFKPQFDRFIGGGVVKKATFGARRNSKKY